MENQPICLFSIGFSTPPPPNKAISPEGGCISYRTCIVVWLRVSCVYMALTAVTIFANFYLFCKIWLLSQD